MRATPRTEGEALPTALALQGKAAAICDGELAKACGRLGRLSAGEREVLASLVAGIAEGILSGPLSRLQGGGEDEYEAILRELFDLDGNMESRRAAAQPRPAGVAVMS
jgi:hypothetical protein